VAYRIVWSDSARERIAEFVEFIAEDNPDAAKRVIEDLRRRIQVLSEQPRMGRPLARDIDSALRRLIAGQYIVVYRIEEPQQIITIVAIRHSRQRSLREEEA
jgi:toxin ParE1/3/4